MIRVSQIKMPIGHTEKELLHKTAKLLRTDPSKIRTMRLVRKSIDARKKPEIFLSYTVDVEVPEEDKLIARCRSGQIQKIEEKSYTFPVQSDPVPQKQPVIAGMGPAGLFCGYMLARHGFRPILLERGRPVDERVRDVETFWKEGIFDPESNVQFGEGGAGTFSDGKLNTLVKDRLGRNREVLRIFVEAGAPEQILYDAKPHIGTDKLVQVVKNIRKKIIEYGGEARFESKVTGICTEGRKLTGVQVNGAELLETDALILAVGHSARDTFAQLYGQGVPMEAKAFAVGLRMEHPRRMIDEQQYGVQSEKLPAASYKVTARTQAGRGVYSFCMCPGGYVVNASSEPERLAVNGMSYSGRDGANSNSAMIVTVTPEDYPDTHPLAGIAFQRELEKKAWQIGQGSIPVERYRDFHAAVTGEPAPQEELEKAYPDFHPQIKGSWQMAAVHEILPERLGKELAEGIDLIGHTLPGFADGGAFLSGVESRTSSPVRISRDDTGQSEIRGLFPCGEGAGYAGGITSAAMDGILIAEKAALLLTQEPELQDKE